MITFGQSLYNLTERDRSTLYVDSFFRTVSGSVPALSDSSDTLLSIPVDRCLFINNISIALDPIALSTWTTAAIRAVSDSGVVYRVFYVFSAALLGDNATTSGAGVQVVLNRNLSLLLPPSTKNVSLLLGRTGNANAATGTCSINGFLLPPGGIGRLA
jgi:hypothetical protein